MKVIFLDIRGVIQPYQIERPSEYDIKELIPKLTEWRGIDYIQYDKYDVGSAYYNWSREAIQSIEYILKRTGAKIVASSNLRDKEKPYKVRDLLGIFYLDKYWIADTEEIEEDDIENSNEYKKYNYRTRQIKKFLRKHPEVENYVAIDDMYLLKGLEGHFIYTDNYITKKQADTCIHALECDTEREQIFERLTLHEQKLAKLKRELRKLEGYINKLG